MRILIDTHVLLWAIATPERLAERHRNVLTGAGNMVFFSAASIWEIGIKAALGKPDFENDPEMIFHEAEAIGFTVLPITPQQAIAAARLPLHHRDPFDRMLIAQAITEPLRLMSTDQIMARYSELVDLV